MIDQLKELLADFERQASDAKESANLYSGITSATNEGQAIAYERAANQVLRLIAKMEGQ